MAQRKDGKSKKPPGPVKLTKPVLDALPATGQRYEVWDEGLEGFGVRVSSSGAKTFVLRYHVGGRKSTRRRVTLGRYGLVTLDQARKRAKKLVGKVLDGEDPAAPDAPSMEPTVKDLAEKFIALHVDPKLRPSTARTYKLILRNEVLPRLGKLKLGDVTRAAVRKLHDGMRATPRHANQTLSVLSKMFALAEDLVEHRMDPNPARAHKRFPEVERDRVPTPEEVAALGKALRQAEKDGTLNPYALAAVRLLLFLGLRKGEVLNLKWSEVDLRARLITIPNPKNQDKNLKVAVNDPAFEVLKKLHAMQILGNPHVLPGQQPKGRNGSLNATWVALRTAAGLKDLRLHDLRHHFGTEGAMLGMSEPMIGALLNHKTAQMTRRYINLANNARAAASDQVGAAIAAKLGERKRKA